MSSMMDATPGTILLPCDSCHVLKGLAVCFCDLEICMDCAPAHLALCAHAKARMFRSWRPPTEPGHRAYKVKREKRS